MGNYVDLCSEKEILTNTDKVKFYEESRLLPSDAVKRIEYVRAWDVARAISRIDRAHRPTGIPDYVGKAYFHDGEVYLNVDELWNEHPQGRAIRHELRSMHRQYGADITKTPERDGW